MILSDNETKVDLLNNEPIAKTIVELLRKHSDHPITIGVHGDWGAGKSSVLEMVEASLDSEKRRAQMPASPPTQVPIFQQVSPGCHSAGSPRLRDLQRPDAA